MNELHLVFEAVQRLGLVLVYSIFYTLGGRHIKLFRRMIAPLILGIGLLLIGGFKWQALSLLALFPPLFFGYSNHFERVGYALVYGSSGFIICAAYGNWAAALFQFFLTLYANTYLGIRNPVCAVYEETLIGALSVIMVAFIV